MNAKGSSIKDNALIASEIIADKQASLQVNVSAKDFIVSRCFMALFANILVII